jgi:hypothetical protein
MQMGSSRLEKHLRGEMPHNQMGEGSMGSDVEAHGPVLRALATG